MVVIYLFCIRPSCRGYWNFTECPVAWIPRPHPRFLVPSFSFTKHRTPYRPRPGKSSGGSWWKIVLDTDPRCDRSVTARSLCEKKLALPIRMRRLYAKPHLVFLASLSATELTFGGRFLVSNPRFSFSRSSFSPTPLQRSSWYQTPAGVASSGSFRLTKKFLKKVLDIYPMRSYLYTHKEEHMKNKIINLIPEATILSLAFVILTITGVISW